MSHSERTKGRIGSAAQDDAIERFFGVATDSGRGRRGAEFVRWVIAALLIATAILKLWEPRDAVALAKAYGVPWGLSAAAVQVELLLASLLAFNVAPRRTLWATAAMFAAFACFSGYRAVAGYESCGCFGPIKVHPWVTTALDIVIVAAATWAAGRAEQTADGMGRLKNALAAYALCGLAWMAFAGPQVVDADSELASAGGLVILEPERWAGGRFPLADHLRPPVDVSTGRWSILLFHHDCADCQEALPKYDRLAAGDLNPGGRNDSGVRDYSGAGHEVLLVEVPPHGERAPAIRHAHYARLSDDREWFVQAPVEVSLVDGQVVGASLELPAVSR